MTSEVLASDDNYCEQKSRVNDSYYYYLATVFQTDFIYYPVHEFYLDFSLF